MPTWQPNWNDVSFDFAGAHEAIAQCQSTRRVLEDRAHVLAGPLRSAREEWRGRKREMFDDDEAALERTTKHLIEVLIDAERGITRDIDNAHLEQARRVKERELWRAEAAEEEAAEQRREQARIEAERAERQKATAAVPTTPAATTTTVPTAATPATPNPVVPANEPAKSRRRFSDAA